MAASLASKSSKPTSSQDKAAMVTTGSNRLTATGSSGRRSNKKVRRRVVQKDERPPFVLEVDDETDADISAVLNDWSAPVGFDMVNLSVRSGSMLHDSP